MAGTIFVTGATGQTGGNVCEQLIARGDHVRALVRNPDEAAVVTVPGCSAASIALVAQGTSRTAATSSHVAIEVDVAQYVLDEGPCLDAVGLGRRVRVDFLDADEEYEHFAARAIEA